MSTITRGTELQNFKQRSRDHVHTYVIEPICLFVAYLSKNHCGASLNKLGI